MSNVYPDPYVLDVDGRLVGEEVQRGFEDLSRRAAPPEAQRAPALAANWSDYSPTLYDGAAYYKHDERVYLQGMIKKSIAVVAGETVFTLPVGYRPALQILFVTISNSVIGRVDVLPTGAVQVVQGNAAWVSLNGLSFRLG